MKFRNIIDDEFDNISIITEIKKKGSYKVNVKPNQLIIYNINERNWKLPLNCTLSFNNRKKLQVHFVNDKNKKELIDNNNFKLKKNNTGNSTFSILLKNKDIIDNKGSIKFSYELYFLNQKLSLNKNYKFNKEEYIKNLFPNISINDYIKEKMKYKMFNKNYLQLNKNSLCSRGSESSKSNSNRKDKGNKLDAYKLKLKEIITRKTKIFNETWKNKKISIKKNEIMKNERINFINVIKHKANKVISIKFWLLFLKSRKFLLKLNKILIKKKINLIKDNIKKNNTKYKFKNYNKNKFNDYLGNNYVYLIMPLKLIHNMTYQVFKNKYKDTLVKFLGEINLRITINHKFLDYRISIIRIINKFKSYVINKNYKKYKFKNYLIEKLNLFLEFEKNLSKKNTENIFFIELKTYMKDFLSSKIIDDIIDLLFNIYLLKYIKDRIEFFGMSNINYNYLDENKLYQNHNLFHYLTNNIKFNKNIKSYLKSFNNFKKKYDKKLNIVKKKKMTSLQKIIDKDSYCKIPDKIKSKFNISINKKYHNFDIKIYFKTNEDIYCLILKIIKIIKYNY